MITDQITTVETSKRLLELGVPAENASMCWSEIAGERRLLMKVPGPYVVPAFTVFDLLAILPAQIEDEGMTLEMSCSRYGESWAVQYYNQEHNYGLTYICYDLIGALYLAVSGLVNKGYKLKL